MGGVKAHREASQRQFCQLIFSIFRRKAAHESTEFGSLEERPRTSTFLWLVWNQKDSQEGKKSLLVRGEEAALKGEHFGELVVFPKISSLIIAQLK